jgi:coatomer subunit epsilon
MDPFSGEGGKIHTPSHPIQTLHKLTPRSQELLTITTHFHTHAYPKVLEYDITSLSPPNRTVAKILQHRSRIALGQSRQVLSELSSTRDPSSQALKALAQHSLGNTKGLELARELADKEGEDSVVQVICGTVLASAGEVDKALELLGKHQGNLEAYVSGQILPAVLQNECI